MTSSSHLNNFNSNSIELIRIGDRLNRSLGAFLKRLSRFVVGFIILIFLLPFSLAVMLITSLTSRVMFEYFIHKIQKAIKKIPETEDRELMNVNLSLEETISLLNKSTKGLQSSNTKKLYSRIFFGSSLTRLVGILELMHSKIESKVYPDLNNDLSQDQIEELIKSYEGVSIED